MKWRLYHPSVADKCWFYSQLGQNEAAFERRGQVVRARDSVVLNLSIVIERTIVVFFCCERTSERGESKC